MYIVSQRESIMGKRKIIPSTPNKVVQKKLVVNNTAKDLFHKSEVLCKRNKLYNSLANISHKNSFGANNWQKFLDSQPQLKPHIKKTVSSFDNITKAKTSKSTNLKTRVRSTTVNQCPLLPQKKNIVLGINTNNCHSIGNSKKFDSKPNSYKSSLKSDSVLKPEVIIDDHNTSRPSLRIRPNRFISSNRTHSLTKQIAMDCEMVGVEIGVKNSILARVSLVNFEGECIYDKYVKPTEPVLDYRTCVSGVRPKDLEDATDFKTVQKEVADILSGRILVGHALKNDLNVLFLTHPKHLIRDTSKFKNFREGKSPALKKLAEKYLGVSIQEGEHNSVQDALAAMQLYKMFRREWEASICKIKRPGLLNQKAKASALSLTLDV